MHATDRWEQALASWAIPQSILDQAPENPWVHPPEMFRVDPAKTLTVSPSTQIALDALAEPGSVLDVGCGGGGSCIALADHATLLMGVDEQAGMLTNFLEAAQQRGVEAQSFLGKWPDVAGNVPVADVVVCHHVVYNVGNIQPFVRALTDHAVRRVVVELPETHPTSPFNPLWQRFWNLDRPTQPNADDFVAVVRELGYLPAIERFTRPPRKANLPSEDYVAFVRRRLCLPSSRDHEIVTALDELGPLDNPHVATVWWNPR
jgi:SAM-dependent methyltransferase